MRRRNIVGKLTLIAVIILLVISVLSLLLTMASLQKAEESYLQVKTKLENDFSVLSEALDNKVDMVKPVNGVDGKDGISVNGDRGEKGDKGDPGRDGSDGVPGRDGRDGLTPEIGYSEKCKLIGYSGITVKYEDEDEENCL